MSWLDLLWNVVFSDVVQGWRVFWEKISYCRGTKHQGNKSYQTGSFRIMFYAFLPSSIRIRQGSHRLRAYQRRANSKSPTQTLNSLQTLALRMMGLSFFCYLFVFSSKWLSSFFWTWFESFHLERTEAYCTLEKRRPRIHVYVARSTWVLKLIDGHHFHLQAEKLSSSVQTRSQDDPNTHKGTR